MNNTFRFHLPLLKRHVNKNERFSQTSDLRICNQYDV